jgi:DNA-binding transcriptional MerR regulator
MENEVPVKPYSPGEIAQLYGVTTKTLRTWIQPHLKTIGPRIGRYFSVLQVRLIFEKLGTP